MTQLVTLHHGQDLMHGGDVTQLLHIYYSAPWRPVGVIPVVHSC